MFVCIFVSGIYVKYDDMRFGFKGLSYIFGYIKYGMEGIIEAMYEGHCHGPGGEIKGNLSFMLSFITMKENDFFLFVSGWTRITIVFVFTAVAKVAVFVVIIFKFRSDYRL